MSINAVNRVCKECDEYNINKLQCEMMKTSLFVIYVTCPGPVIRLRRVSRAERPPSDCDVIPQCLSKTTSLCQGM